MSHPKQHGVFQSVLYRAIDICMISGVLSHGGGCKHACTELETCSRNLGSLLGSSWAGNPCLTLEYSPEWMISAWQTPSRIQKVQPRLVKRRRKPNSA